MRLPHRRSLAAQDSKHRVRLPSRHIARSLGILSYNRDIGCRLRAGRCLHRQLRLFKRLRIYQQSVYDHVDLVCPPSSPLQDGIFLPETQFRKH
jgi:hypothetical protein